MDFTHQLDRIKSKLAAARIRDAAQKAFGADAHHYELDKPVSPEMVAAFERQHNISLPPAYVAFITTIGHDGPGYYGAAGPYYGIYPLDEFGYMQIDSASMSAPCRIHSALSPDEWDDMIAFSEELDEDSIEYDQQYKQLFDGLMTIGTQGCNFQTMICLNGKDQGRIVNIDQDLQRPFFAKEENFLDWYEAWLDRILQQTHT